MMKISWKITDIIENVDFKVFNKEWNGIYGYFEICINNQILGFCPEITLIIPSNNLYNQYKISSFPSSSTNNSLSGQ